MNRDSILLFGIEHFLPHRKIFLRDFFVVVVVAVLGFLGFFTTLF